MKKALHTFIAVQALVLLVAGCAQEDTREAYRYLPDDACATALGPASEILILANADFPPGDYLIMGSESSVAVAGSLIDSMYGPGPGYPVYDSPRNAPFAVTGGPILNSATGGFLLPGTFDLGRSRRPINESASVWGLEPAEGSAPSSLSPSSWSRICPDALGSRAVKFEIEAGGGPVPYAGLLWTAESRATNLTTLVSIAEDGLLCLIAPENDFSISDTRGATWILKKSDCEVDDTTRGSVLVRETALPEEPVE